MSVAVALPVTAGSVEAPQLMVMSFGSVNTGLVLSTMVITCVEVAKLPAASVAFQVRVILLPTVTSLYVTTGVPQLSDAFGVPPHEAGSVEALQLRVISPSSLITGLVLSTMVIVWVAVIKLPDASVAFHVLVITLFALASLYVMFTLLQLSAPVAVPVAFGLVDEPQFTVALFGTVIVGLTRSTTVIVWLAVI